MKRPSVFLRRDDNRAADQAMTPMIDVIFLLLVFFVCTASLQLIEQILASQMSSTIGNDPSEIDQPPPEEMDFDQVVIRIGWNEDRPTYAINRAPLESLDQVRDHLKNLATVRVDVPLILHPDPPVPMGYVISAYDEAKLAGFPKVSFAVNPQGVQ
jgi:biopolymer transport protein ExbD